MIRWRILGGPTLTALVTLLGALAPPPAQAWEWFRSPNPEVRRGNRALQEKDVDGALRHYDRAARSLPGAPGVQLNRGIALLQKGELKDAREALRRATDPEASTQVRADAYYNLGLSFFSEADAKSQEEDHGEAQRLFREAADSFRSALRQSPGNRDAAWNLELAKRRITEEEAKEQEKKQDEKEDQDEDSDNQDPQDSEEQGSEEQGPEGQDPNDQNPQDQENNPDDQDPQAGQEGQPENQSPEPGDDERQEEAEAPPLPSDVERALSAIESGEESLQKHQAQMRARRERRRVEKDW
ncbi:MAG: tetratricopeptide repeat protein [Myxococcales bacterium]|nr:tetratricopeptide repeat protein [Myxococcales bacterium]